MDNKDLKLQCLRLAENLLGVMTGIAKPTIEEVLSAAEKLYSWVDKE